MYQMSGPERIGGSQTRSLSVLHIFSGERLQAFSDAVFAIIATLMVIPLKLERDEVEKHGIAEFDLQDFMLDQWPRYLVYVYSFYLVVDMWSSHVGIFSMVEQVDDVILWLNLLFLVLVSFLPYGIGLVSSFPWDNEGELLAVTVCSVDLLLIGICLLIILLYVFRKQSLLHPGIENDSNIVSIRRASIISVIITPAMSLLALAFSFVTEVPTISLLFFYCISIFSFVSRLIVYFYYKRKRLSNILPCHLFNSVDGTCRTEAFSDGVFAIVATLIVLDLTTGIPSGGFPGTLNDFIKGQRFVIVSYITSFVIVGLLWFVHYGMMHFVIKMTPLLSFLNNTTLFLVGCIPFISGIDSIFSVLVADEGVVGLTANKSVSIRSLCVLVFLVSMMQLLFWTVAIWNKNKCLSRDVDQNEGLQFAKLLVFPGVSFVIFWCTFSDTFMSYGIYDFIIIFSIPSLFLLLKARIRAVKKIVAWFRKRRLDRRYDQQVNSCAEERTALITEDTAGGAHLKMEVPTTHVRMVGKGNEADIEVTVDDSSS